jgi:hypothetical protein
MDSAVPPAGSMAEIDVAPPPAIELVDSVPRAAQWTLQLGLLVAAVAVTTYREFELDRFYVPKELALHATALVAGILLLRRGRASGFGIVDALLALFVLLSAASAVLATNHWLAFRALAITVSGVVIFWCASELARRGAQRPLLAAVAATAVAAVATALLQAYGVRHDVFSLNRAPGGTLGNRNSIAHIAAFSLPLVIVCALGARRWYGYLLGAAGTMLVMTGLVLTRSRAGWLGFAAVLVMLAGAFVIAPALRRSRRTVVRLAGLLLLGGAGAGAAVLLPNTLQWRSDNPYLDSLRGVAQYQEGSGAGRLVQYRHSLNMAAAAPVLGAGPGNWPVRYPEHAAPRDPSMSGGTPGTTSNPWPSSDWVAFVSERGYAAALVLLLVFAILLVTALRRLRAADDADSALPAAALAAMIAGVLVVGAFDAVLLLALPAFIVFAALGAIAPQSSSGRAPRLRRGVLIALLAITAVGVVRSSAQLAGMHIYTQTSNATALSRAALIDPGNFRLRVRLARANSGLPRAERCRHARAAHALMPSAQEARNLSRRCN